MKNGPFLRPTKSTVDNFDHYGHRHRSKILTKHALPHVSGARAARRPTRPAMGGARAKSQRDQPLRVLNRGTGAPGVGDVSTPSNSNRAGRPQKEVHGAVRTRPTSERLRNSEKTTSSIYLGPLTSLFKAPRRVQERQGQHLSVEDRVAFAKLAHVSVKLGLMGMTELCRQWRITPTHEYRILARYREEQSVATRPRSGRPCALDTADLRTLERISEEAGGYVTWDGFAEKFNEETGKNVCAKPVYILL